MRRVRRLLVTGLVALFAITGTTLGAWLNGTRLPFASGATLLHVTKLHASYLTPAAGASGDVVYVMFVGSDLRPGVGGARGDALHLLAVNTKLHRATLVDFPRDTCTDVPGRGHVRINEANSVGGAALTAQVVGRIVGVPVQYAVEVDFAGFLGLVDGVGGVDVNIPFAMHDTRYSGANFPAGPKHLDGNLALAFGRDRHDFGKGDIQRSWNQAYLMIAAMSKLQREYASFAGHFELAALLVRHAQLSGLSIGDLVRLGQLADGIPADAIANVAIPLGGSGCLDIAPPAQALFADVRDDGVLESYPHGTAASPDPLP